MLLNVIKPYIVAFIPIFLAVDIIGTVPLFLGLTEGLTGRQKNKILTDSVIIATILAVLFIFLGKAVFRGLGITIDDFKIAGGVLLFILSVYLLMPGNAREFLMQSLYEDIGIFPLATPLITGPAVLVTTMMLVDSFGMSITLSALIFNMAIAWLVLRYSNILLAVIGNSGVKALSKISYIFLAAIGVMITREGIMGVIFSF